MGLTWFIEQVNMRAVAKNLVRLTQLFGLLMLLPLAVSLLCREFTFTWLFGLLAAGTFAPGLFWGGREEDDLSLKDALVVTALAYLWYVLLGALAFLPIASFANSFFEAMSGFTTTGLSVLNPDTLPKTLLFFRAYAQWLGGAGIIVMSLVVLLRPGRSAVKLYALETGQKNLVGNVKATALMIFNIYLALTAAGFLVYWAAGLGPFDALLHIMATLSTGGFSSHRDGLAHYHSAALELAVIVFMVIGATNFSLFSLLRERKWQDFFGDLQSRWLIGLLLAAALVIWAAWGWLPGRLIASLFQATSALTTTGFQSVPVAGWPPAVKLVCSCLMVAGGAAGSTAGGIKLFRLILMVQLVRWVVLSLLLPAEARLPHKYGGLVVADRDVKQIFALVALYLAIVAGAALLLTLGGFGIVNSFFESASALGTVGLSSGLTSPALPFWAKLVLSLEMWAGRIEILPVLVLFYPAVWLPKKREEK